MLREIQGDILKRDAEWTVIPVNCVGTMGKGLALAAKRQASAELERRYRELCRSGELRPGVVVLLDWRPGRKMVMFPTKDDWRHPSRLEWIRDGMESLRELAEREQPGTIAIPALGTGLGGLPWHEVEPVIRQAVEGMEAEILLYPPR